MRCLVTGGAGFIGSNLVDALLDAGHDVAVLDDLSTGRRANLEGALARGAVLHELDVADAPAVGALVADARPDWVFHLAAQIDVRKAVADPAHDARINVAGTAGLLEAARAAGVERFVFASTGGALYGEADAVPTPEDAPLRPLAPYGQSKAAAEGYLRLYERLHGFDSVALRYGNVYGPRQDPLGEAGVIAIFCGALLEGRDPVVFGDGRQTRDYVHVDDVVQANIAAAEAGVSGSFNIGRGEETSVLDLVEALRELGGGRPFEPRFEPERPGEVRRSCLDPGAAERAFNWRARLDLREGLRSTLAWAQSAAAA